MNTRFRTLIALSLIGTLAPTLPAGAQNGYQSRTNRPSMVDTSGLPAVQFYHGQRHADIVNEGMILHECRRQPETNPNIDGMMVPPLPARNGAGGLAGAGGQPLGPGVTFDNPMIGGLNSLPNSHFGSNIPNGGVKPNPGLQAGQSISTHVHMAPPARNASTGSPSVGQRGGMPSSGGTAPAQLARYQDNVASVGTGRGSGGASTAVHGVVKKLLEKQSR